MALTTISQARAQYALTAAEVVPEVQRAEFKRVIEKAPSHVLTNGLIMTLVFWEGKSTDAHKRAEAALGNWIMHRFAFGRGRTQNIPSPPEGNERNDTLFKALTQSPSGETDRHCSPNPGTAAGLLFATDEALELLNWMKRMVGRTGYAPRPQNQEQEP